MLLKKNKKEGFSLIELLLVLGVIAVLSVVAFFTFQKLNDNMIAKENAEAVDEVLIAMQEVQMDYVKTGQAEELSGKGSLEPEEILYKLSPGFIAKYYKADDNTFRFKTGESFGDLYPFVHEVNGEIIPYLGVHISNDNPKAEMTTAQCVAFLSKLNGSHMISTSQNDDNAANKRNITLKQITDACNEEDRVMSISLGEEQVE